MDYQLVIKFWRKSLQDQDFLAKIQGELEAALGTPPPGMATIPMPGNQLFV